MPVLRVVFPFPIAFPIKWDLRHCDYARCTSLPTTSYSYHTHRMHAIQHHTHRKCFLLLAAEVNAHWSYPMQTITAEFQPTVAPSTLKIGCLPMVRPIQTSSPTYQKIRYPAMRHLESTVFLLFTPSATSDTVERRSISAQIGTALANLYKIPARRP